MGSCIEALTNTTTTTPRSKMADVETTPAPEPVTEVTESTESLTVEEVSNEAAAEETKAEAGETEAAPEKEEAAEEGEAKESPAEERRVRPPVRRLRPRLWQWRRQHQHQNKLLQLSKTSFIYLEYHLVCRLV